MNATRMELYSRRLVALFSASAPHEPSPNAVTGTTARSGWLNRTPARLVDTVLTWRRRQRLRFALDRLSDRMLADIGFSRDRIDQQIPEAAPRLATRTGGATLRWTSKCMNDAIDGMLHRALRGQITVALFGMARPAGH